MFNNVLVQNEKYSLIYVRGKTVIPFRSTLPWFDNLAEHQQQLRTAGHVLHSDSLVSDLLWTTSTLQQAMTVPITMTWLTRKERYGQWPIVRTFEVKFALGWRQLMTSLGHISEACKTAVAAFTSPTGMYQYLAGGDVSNLSLWDI